MLKQVSWEFYQVKKGQRLRDIADYFGVAEGLLVKLNGLTKPPYAGQILRIPQGKGNIYFVQEGDTKALLCGSEENFRIKNGTDTFYIGMRVVI